MGWVTYSNLSRKSSVRSYNLRSNRGIWIRFKGVGIWGGLRTSEYRYSKNSTKTVFLVAMKRYAQEGRGLNTFINRVHPGYYSRR